MAVGFFFRPLCHRLCHQCVHALAVFFLPAADSVLPLRLCELGLMGGYLVGSLLMARYPSAAVPIFRRGYAKRETTISMGQNMQMCHSLRCKQIDMSTANDLKSIFPNNAGGTCTCNRVKTG